jgi:hypothetical protein
MAESFDDEMRRVWRETPLSVNVSDSSDVPVEDSNCNYCGHDYFEEESDASSPGMYCSEQCEIDEEEESNDE